MSEVKYVLVSMWDLDNKELAMNSSVAISLMSIKQEFKTVDINCAFIVPLARFFYHIFHSFTLDLSAYKKKRIFKLLLFKTISKLCHLDLTFGPKDLGNRPGISPPNP